MLKYYVDNDSFAETFLRCNEINFHLSLHFIVVNIMHIFKFMKMEIRKTTISELNI